MSVCILANLALFDYNIYATLLFTSDLVRTYCSEFIKMQTAVQLYHYTDMVVRWLHSLAHVPKQTADMFLRSSFLLDPVEGTMMQSGREM